MAFLGIKLKDLEQGFGNFINTVSGFFGAKPQPQTTSQPAPQPQINIGPKPSIPTMNMTPSQMINVQPSFSPLRQQADSLRSVVFKDQTQISKPSINLPGVGNVLDTIRTEAPKTQLNFQQEVKNKLYQQTGKEPNIFQNLYIQSADPNSFLGKSFIGQQFKQGAEAATKGDYIGAGKATIAGSQDVLKQALFAPIAFTLTGAQKGLDDLSNALAVKVEGDTKFDWQKEYEKNMDLVRQDKTNYDLAANIGESSAAAASLFGNEKLAADIRNRANEVRQFGTEISPRYDATSTQSQLGEQGANIIKSIGVSLLPGGVALNAASAWGRVYDEMVTAGVNPKTASIAAGIYAPVEATLDKVSAKTATKGALGPFKNFIIGLVSEGSTEGAQQLAENVIRKLSGDKSIESVWQGVPESAAVGGLIGGGVSVASTRPTAARPTQIQQTPSIVPTRPATPTQINIQTAPKVATQIAEPGTTQEAAQLLQQQIEQAQGKYPQENILRKGERKFVDPFALAARIDRATAKQLGVKVLPKSQSLEAKLDIAIGNPDLRLEGRLKDFGIDKILQKYPEGTSAGNEFNTYRIAKFAEELYTKRKINIMPGPNGTQLSPEAVTNIVKDYEAKNPNAIADNQKLNELFKDTTQRAEDAGVLEPGTAKYLGGLYKYYASIDRVLPEALVRPEIGISPIGTIGRQSIVQSIEGSNMPIDTSWEATIGRLRNAERQIARAAAGRVYLQAIEAGTTIKGKSIGRVIQSREQILAIRSLRDDLAEIRDITKQLIKQRGKITAQTRVENIKLKQSQTKLINQVKFKLRNTVVDPDAKVAINDLTIQDISEIAANMTQDGVWRNAQSFANKSAKHAKLVNELQSIRQQINLAKETGKEIQTQITSIQPDPTTGLQTVTVLDQGVPVKIETTPEVANLLQRMDEKKLNGIVKFASYLSRPFRTAFTGWLNPIFSSISFTFYDAPMGVINSKNGWRTLISPSAIKSSLQSVSTNNQFQRRLAESGAQLTTGSLTGSELTIDPRYIASRKNLFTKLKYGLNPKNIKSTINSFDLLGGKLGGVTRTRIAKVAYDTAIRQGMNKDMAIQEAVYAYNNIMPNYQRTTSALKQIDAFIPYTSASIAGTRALGKAVRNRPLSTLGKTAIFTAPMVAVVAASFANADDAEEFYKDQINAKKEYVLDANMIILTEGARKDPKTGEWEGVIKIPVPPELRNVNGIIWRQTYDNITGNNLATPKAYADAIFNTITGGIFQFVNNPFVSTVVALTTGKDVRYGTNIIPEDISYLPTNEQYTKNTTELSKQIGDAIGQPPAKVQFVFDQFGLTGRLASGKSEIFEEVKDRFVGAKGVSEGAQYFKNLESDKKSIPGWNSNDESAYTSLHPRKKDSRGIDIWDDDVNIYNPVARLEIYNRYPKVLELDKKQNQRNIDQGKPGNPLFNLEQSQLRKVLEKEALPAGTKDPELDKLFTQEWYVNYRADKKEFFDKLKNLAAKEGWEFAKSDNPYPQTPPALQAAMDEYNKLKKGTGARSAWIRSNPQLFEAMKAQWAAIDDWQNRQRAKRGLAATEGAAGVAGGFATDTSQSNFNKRFTKRFNQPFVSLQNRKIGNLRVPTGKAGKLPIGPGKVIVRTTKA